VDDLPLATLTPAALGRRGPRLATPFSLPTVEDHLDGNLLGERPLKIAVALRFLARDDEQQRRHGHVLKYSTVRARPSSKSTLGV
jgi:hypothetical protein